MAHPTDLELELLAKFSEKLQDLDFGDMEDPQNLLLRFLKARDQNISKAEEMLRKHMEWRRRHEIHNILSWEAPSILKEQYPYEISGFDKEGSPVLLVPFGVWDVRKICELRLKSDYVRYVDQLFIKVTQAMSQSGKVNGKPITQFICVFVPDKFYPLRQLSSVQAVDTVLETVKRFEANHPETLKAAFVIDAPRVFQMMFSMIKPLLNSKTIGKVTISSNPSEWKPALLELVAGDQLPFRMGGTRPSTIPLLNDQVEIEDGSSDQRNSFIAVTVQPGRSVSIQFDVQTSSTNFIWSFETDSHDIGFSVLVDETDVVVPYSRANSHEDVQCGSVILKKCGKYSMVFDNSFSRWRSKVVRYRVTLQEVVDNPSNLDEESEQLNRNGQMETLSL